MGIPEAVIELENRSIGKGGEATIASAYLLLREEWRSGNRDREVGLHLMFLAWYCLAEPPFLTGLNEAVVPPSELPGVFFEVHDFFAPGISNDVEMLYVVGLMAHLFPYLLGEEETISEFADKYRNLYRSLAPNGVPAQVFDNRGAYGHYFAHQAQATDGY